MDKCESQLREIYRLIFHAGIDAMKKERLLRDNESLFTQLKRPSFRKRFIRACHYGFDLAQRKICAGVIELAEQTSSLKKELKDARRARDKQLVGDIEKQMGRLLRKQLVLRRAADAILYHLIAHKNWVLRRVILEERVREIDISVLRRTLEIATEMNRSDRETFNLISDLTTTVHVGDLVQLSFRGENRLWKLVELKEGKVNELLREELKDKSSIDIETEKSRIAEQFGDKAAAQVTRMLRQRQREEAIEQFRTADAGIDIQHNVQVHLRPEEVVVQDYGKVVRGICEQTAEKGMAHAAVDSCLIIVGVQGQIHRNIGHRGIAHQFFHLQHPERQCSLRDSNAQGEELDRINNLPPIHDLVDMNLSGMWAPPLFLWPVKEELVFDLLFGRLKLFVQLDYQRFFLLAATEGIDLQWTKRKDLGELAKLSKSIPGSPGAAGVTANILNDPLAIEQHLLIGFFARIFLELMCPRQLIALIKKGAYPPNLRTTPGGR
jgi:hypothetical protein